MVKADLKVFESLFYTSSIEDFLSQFYKKINRHTKVSALVLYYPSLYFGPIQYVCSAKGVLRRSVEEYKPSDVKDSVYLARSLGRPIHHILRFPIPVQGSKSPIFLFIESSAKQADKGIEFYRPFAPLIESGVNRLLRREHLQESMRLWTASFNSLGEPLAVFDEKAQAQSANKMFDTVFKNDSQQVFQQKTFQWGNHCFEKHSYPVNIKGDKYIIYHYVDITESLNLRNKMIQNIRLSALGQLGANVAHQLNNPLTGILSMAQLMLSKGNLSAEEQKDMQDIAEGVSRAQAIIANLLSFARMDSQLTVCDMNAVVKKTLPFLKSLICWVDLRMDFSPDPLLVKIQLCLGQQVVFNLLKNACQAVENLERPLRQIHVRVCQQGKQVLLSVEDSGVGISTDDYKNIFKPFWTTKKEGTGLGLNLSHDIVQSFGGRLTAGPSSLGGACFVLSLPLSPTVGKE